MKRALVSILLAAAIQVQIQTVRAQTPASNLRVEVNNFVLYNYDTFNTAEFGMNPKATSVAMKTYNYHISIGDITAVSGVSAKGTVLCTHTMFILSPTAVIGSMAAMADTSRSMVDDCSVEILSGSGAAVGTIYFRGLFGGPPPPGAPANSSRSNLIVTGGTGAFLGVKGQATQTGPWTPRVASVTEDPANRRVNGGGAQTILLQLFPMFRPSILATPGGPAVVHSSDFSLVTAAKPAQTGELLTLFASGLGPTNPSVDYGQPFPSGASAPVTSPVQVSLNGNAAEVLYAGSYPGAVDGYQVNFRAPSGAGPGPATLGLAAAFISGNPVTIPMQ